MRSSSNTRNRKRATDRAKTNDPQRDPGHGPACLYIVGTGPGDIAHLSKRAAAVLKRVDTVVGYTTYVDLIADLITHKEIISTGMMGEVDRVQAAIDAALEGKACAIVCGGDPGIYALAGLAFEICEQREIAIVPPGADAQTDPNTLCVEVVPGIPALGSGASLLGAPLTHDFAAISLSDLLTPWEIIEKRVRAAAQADFVIVLYNPKSKKRKNYIHKVQQIVMNYRDGKTPVGIVVSAMRARQEVRIVSLKDLHLAYANMQTIIFIGNSTSRRYRDFMYTPRGYSGKYDIAGSTKKGH